MQNRSLHQKSIGKSNKTRDVIDLDIRKKVAQLKKKYGTNNPFELASCLGISVFFEELGSINGYYNKQLRMKQIHINCNLPEHIQKFTCAHELGHALLHPNSNTPFLRNHTGFSINRMEMEADKFAIDLLITDDDLREYQEFTTEQLSRLFGYHIRLINLRLEGE